MGIHGEIISKSKKIVDRVKVVSKGKVVIDEK